MAFNHTVIIAAYPAAPRIQDWLIMGTFAIGVQRIALRYRRRFPNHAWFCSTMVADRAYERRHCQFIRQLGEPK
jgi:hypothetical protein